MDMLTLHAARGQHPHYPTEYLDADGVALFIDCASCLMEYMATFPNDVTWRRTQLAPGRAGSTCSVCKNTMEVS